MKSLFCILDKIKIDWEDLQSHLLDIRWEYLEDPQRSYSQYYKSYQPLWLTQQLLPIWHSMGFLLAGKAGAYIEPHVDYKRTCAILIPCSHHHGKVSLDFWNIPRWTGNRESDLHFKKEEGTIINSVAYSKPLLMRNVPHGLDNTQSDFDRVNLSVCFLPPYNFDVILDLYKRGLLLNEAY